MLYRIIRYRESLLVETAEKFFDAEFAHEADPNAANYDPNISVFEVDEAELIQIHAEYTANISNNEPRGSNGVDVEDLAPQAQPDDSGGHFSFIRSHHRLVGTHSHEAARAFAIVLFAQLRTHGRRVFHFEKDEVRKYVRGRVEQRDPEWLAFLAGAPRRWQKFGGYTSKQ